MDLLRALSLLAVPLALTVAPFVACSSDSGGSGGGGASFDAGGAFSTKLEAGANCGASGDCVTGLVCLFPASATSTCSMLAVCVTPPPDPCPQAQTMCSCLAEPIQVCQGYAENPVDPTATCEAGTVVPPADGGSDSAPPADGGNDSAGGVDSGDSGTDAADSATD